MWLTQKEVNQIFKCRGKTKLRLEICACASLLFLVAQLLESNVQWFSKHLAKYVSPEWQKASEEDICSLQWKDPGFLILVLTLSFSISDKDRFLIPAMGKLIPGSTSLKM